MATTRPAAEPNGPAVRATTDFSFARFFQPLAILRFKRFLDRSERYTRDRLAAYQDARLRALVAYAAAHVPYYRALFRKEGLVPDDIAGAADLARLPPLTKEILREHATELVSDEFARLRPVLTRTSGSSGTPLAFHTDKHLAAAKFAAFWRVWGWAGYRPWQRWANLGGAVLAPGQLWERVRSMNALYLSSFLLTPFNAARMLEKLRDFRPVFLRGYPSALVAFARLVDDGPALRRLGIRGISTNSETLLDHQRAAIEEAFGCPVQDVYSQWEPVCIIAGCRHGSLHHQMEYGILEILDADGAPAPPGVPGEIVATGFANRVTPFIRYRTGDRAVRSGRACACGRAHDVVNRIDGRIEDLVVTPDGRRVGRLDAAFKHNRGFDCAQVVQDRPDRIVVRLVRNRGFDDREQALLERQLRARLGDAIRIDYAFVPRIAPGANGKLRFVVSRLAGDPDGGRAEWPQAR